MPSPLGHTAIGLATYDLCCKNHYNLNLRKILIFIIVLANLPDIDMVIGLIIHGNGNTIQLSDGGAIVLGSDAHVEFRNVRIQGISGNNVRCTDDDGVISLDTVTWLQEGDYVFSNGALQVKNKVTMEGVYNFGYHQNDKHGT